MDNKSFYRKFSETELSLPIFLKDWWLDTVCGKDGWDVALAKKNDQVVGAFPYFVKKKSFFQIITLPKFTQFTGPYLKYPETKRNEKIYSFEKDALTSLLEEMPKTDRIFLNINPDVQNGLPFYWKGFNQTTRYTYIIKETKNLDQVFENFRSNIKTDIRKAEKVLMVEEIDDVELMFNIASMTFKRQSMPIPYTLEDLKKLDNVLSARGYRKILLAKDSTGNSHACIYIVWDNVKTYYLLSGGNPEYRNSGATSLLVWQGITHASKIGTSFDFEGSSVEPIERVFRAFGGERRSILQVSKTNSFLLKLREFLLSF